jgi:hypothetical protein
MCLLKSIITVHFNNKAARGNNVYSFTTMTYKSTKAKVSTLINNYSLQGVNNYSIQHKNKRVFISRFMFSGKVTNMASFAMRV